jgi:hypothetical protein
MSLFVKLKKLLTAKVAKKGRDGREERLED